jgi:UDP-N-acetylmuramoyl-tripeptide--D-alanyl-D-alanine ligase
MIELSVAQIAEIVSGTIAGVDPDASVTGSVEFDSRLVQPGGLFLALPGERVDGHDYVGEAVGRGAVAAFVTRPVDGPHILVRDGYRALAALASAVVRRLPDITVIGVTGSSGKTSTKDMLAQVLSTAGRTVAPPGSFNNELGHPYTVLRADESTRFLVLETSARGIGHIRHLTEIAPPRIGVELNVGSAHLGEFGSREAIAQAKGELVEALPDADSGGVAVLNADDPMVMAMATRTSARIVTTGERHHADVRADRVTLDELGRARFVLLAGDGSAPVRLGFAGRHQVANALATAAVALECGLGVEHTAHALSAAVPQSRWRMELRERGDGALVVNDAYNANPESMGAALHTLAGMARSRAGRGGRAFAVLGPMAELGEASEDEHRAVGRMVAQLGIARLVVVGSAARAIAEGAGLESSWDGEATVVDDVDEAIGLLRRDLRPADVVLVKASRAASLERVALAIAEDSGVSDGAARSGDGTGGAGA